MNGFSFVGNGLFYWAIWGEYLLPQSARAPTGGKQSGKGRAIVTKWPASWRKVNHTVYSFYAEMHQILSPVICYTKYNRFSYYLCSPMNRRAVLNSWVHMIIENLVALYKLENPTKLKPNFPFSNLYI